MIRRLFLALLVVTAAIGAGSMGVAAQPDDESLFDMSVDGECESISCHVASFIGGFDAPDPGAWLQDVRDQEPTVDAEAGNLTTFVNEHNASLVTHSNDVLDHYNGSVQNTTYVLELTIANKEGDTTNTATRYFIAGADGENITSLQATNATTQTVDAEHTIGWHTAEQLNGDLRSYHDQYVTTGEIPGTTYVTKMVTRYNILEVTTGGA